MGVMAISQPISTPIQRKFHHKHIFTCTFKEHTEFLYEKLWSCGIKSTRPQTEILVRPEIAHLWEYHDHRMTFKPLNQQYILMLTTTKISKNISFIALAEPHSASN